MDVINKLTEALDRPTIPWKTIVVGFAIGDFAFRMFLLARQYQVYQHTKPPKVLETEISAEDHKKSQAYSRAKAKFSLASGINGQIQNLAVIYYDLLPKLWDFAGSLLHSYAPERFTGEISQSITFLLIFMFAQQIVGIPWSLYQNFVLEEKFGFNKQTIGVFFADLVKTNILTVVLTPPILAGFLKIIQTTGNQFFYYLFLFFAGLQLFIVTVYPIFILPIFNKLTPLEEGKLKTDVEALAAKLKFPLHNLQVIDGSKRSSHSNAFFTGMPWKKHIVLFDTLIEHHTTEEVVAVLGHELGHWKLNHTTYKLISSQVHIFGLFTVFSIFINNASLYNAFGFFNEHPILIGLLLFSDIMTPVDNIMQFAINLMSRKFEYEADAFAKDLGYTDDLCSALTRLHIKNLSGMDADWLYSAFHNSHPILTERLEALGWKPTKKVVTEDKAAKASGVEL